MLPGITASEAHSENGMTLADMQACSRVADRLDEVIIFRSTGPWAKRWIAEQFPTKNFHVKGKSSDWGPQAGFVPYDGVYSKVGHKPDLAAKGTKANNDGLHSHFAVKAPLYLTAAQIEIQLTQEASGRCALTSRRILPNGNMILCAKRSGDGKLFSFYARARAPGMGDFEIRVFEGSELATHPTVLFHNDPEGLTSKEFLIMGSAETGANGKAMTGDYDLLAVCPRIADRFSQVGASIKKADIEVTRPDGSVLSFKGLEYHAHMGMDNVLDGSLHTASNQQKHLIKGAERMNEASARHAKVLATRAPADELSLKAHKLELLRAQHAAEHARMQTKTSEHADMGNLTPRILRCINMLNAEMGAMGGQGHLRRVHHNAESHRFAKFGALTRDDLDAGEGFPFTAFIPQRLMACVRTAQRIEDKTANKNLSVYDTVCTVENTGEFQTFMKDLSAMDYWVPTNYTWKMNSSRVKDTGAQLMARGLKFPTRSA